MSDNVQNNQPSEEVDLGQLFKAIGNMFDRFFKFIASIFKGIYRFIIMLLMHLYKRLKWYALAIVIGGVLGYYLDKNSDTLYGANMFIETNFKSARQVYENMLQLNQLAYNDKDSVKLAQIFKISVSEAAHLKGFYIDPDIDENFIIEKFSEYYTQLDSTTKADVTYLKFKESLTKYNFKTHRIGVASTDKTIYKKIENELINQLAINPYLHELANVSKENFEREEKALSEQITKTDSLVNEYLKIRINESEKEPVAGSGTNLYMGSAENSGNLIVDESKVLEKRLALESKLRDVYEQKASQSQVINIISDFPETGYDISSWKDKNKFKLPIAFFLITFFGFILFGLGKYLNSEDKRLNSK